MAFFKKDDYLKGGAKVVPANGVTVDNVGEDESDETLLDAISLEARDLKVTALAVGALRGIFKNANAWKHNNLVEFLTTLTDDDELVEAIIPDIEILLETLLAYDEVDDDEIVENIINGEDEDYIDALDLIAGHIGDDVDIENLVSTYGAFIEETLDSVEEFEVDDDVTIDSTAYASMKEAKGGRFNPDKQRVVKSSEHGHKAFRRVSKDGKKLRKNVINAQAKGEDFTASEKKWQRKSMDFLGYWKKGKLTDKMKKKMGLRKRKDGSFGKPKKKGSSKKTPKGKR